MANEAILRDRLENPIDFTVANHMGIEKGTVLQLLDGRVASGAPAIQAQLSGIAAREKVAADGRTQLAVYRRGIFDMVASGAITIGQAVMAKGSNNLVIVAAQTASGACILGHALETAEEAEVFQVYVDVGAGGNHLS